MKKFLTIMTTASILFPAFAAAEDIESYVQRMIENAKQGGGTVIIENHSSVSTGGQVAGAGESVTDGDVSASSHTETRINAGNDGADVYIKTETSRNGETEAKEYTKKVAPGEPIEVNVSAKVTPEEAESEVRVQGETLERSSSTDAQPDAGATIVARFEAAIESVPSFFRKVFSFVKFW